MQSPNRHPIYDMVNEIFGHWLNDIEGLTEIAINRPNELFIKVKGKWIKEEIKLSYETCESFASVLSDYHGGGSVTPETPILSATLPHGERVQVVIPPVCERGKISITIRKPSTVFIDHAEFVKQGFYSRLNTPIKDRQEDTTLVDLFNNNRIDEFIPECLRQGKTIVFCAGTGAGKTTFANACLFYIPHHLRCGAIEDTDEARFRFHENHVKLFYPAEGEDSYITPALLLRSLYRMNPDRILMTEIRGGEAWDFLKGLSSGHAGGLTTVHEKTPEDAITGIIERCQQNKECNNLPYNALLRKVLNNIDVIMSIRYLDEEDTRFASEIYFKDVHRDEYLKRLKE
ncbi:P-type DNA transfer ATPase VirB11 [Escherichia albertii]|nr:P-type DNA transfer ATPase VirB11 [Escherichia albertii]